jgi:hypothetical protein
MSFNLPSNVIEPPPLRFSLQRIRIQLFVVAFRYSISLAMEQKLIDAKRIVFLCAHEFQLLKYFGAIAENDKSNLLVCFVGFTSFGFLRELFV